VSNPFEAGANAMAEVWRSWMTMIPPAGTPTGVDQLGLFAGTQVADALKRMTEGPRLADAGAAEHRMARLTERWIEVQTASRAY
jgi:hypothetical protein